MTRPLNYQTLKDVALSVGLPTYLGNAYQYEGRDYPNLTVLIKADGTGYYAYLNVGVSDRESNLELMAGLEEAFKAAGIHYRASGMTVTGGYRSFEYEITEAAA